MHFGLFTVGRKTQLDREMWNLVEARVAESLPEFEVFELQWCAITTAVDRSA